MVEHALDLSKTYVLAVDDDDNNKRVPVVRNTSLFVTAGSKLLYIYDTSFS